MTLEDGKMGEIYIVNALSLDMVTMRRLEALGLTTGTKVRILNRSRSASIILMVRGSRLALGRKIARAIEIKEAE